jgi:hypothetical protein
MQSGLAASFVTPSPKKKNGKANQAVDDKPYIKERKLSTRTAAKGDSNNGPSQKNGWKCQPSCGLQTICQREEAIEHDGCKS